MNARLRSEPRRYIIEKLHADPDMIEYVEGAPLNVRLDAQMLEDLVRVGWRYHDIVESSVAASNENLADAEVRLAYDVPPVTGIADAYAELEGTMITFEGVLMAASERYGVPHLVLVGEGSEERTVLASEWSERRDGAAKAQKNEDMQEVILEDVTERERPRKINARLYGKGLVDRFTRGQRLRVTGVYRSKPGDPRKGDAYTFWVEILRAEAIDGATRHGWTRAEVDGLRKRRREIGPGKFCELLGSSLAPNVPGHQAVKVSFLLSAVGGSSIRGRPRNIHTLVCGDPGTGKSEILQYVMPLINNSAYGAAESMSARGMTYGMAEWDGRKMLAAGVMVLKRCVGIDEFQTVPTETLDGIKIVMSEQKATYHKTGYSVETPTDCTVIAAMNPADDGWNEDASALANLSPIPAAILTRMNVFRVGMQEDAKGRSDMIMAYVLGDEVANPEVEPELLRHWIEWCVSRPDPVMSREGAQVIHDYFVTFLGRRPNRGDNSLVQGRLEMGTYRNACGFARLCGDARATKEHAELALALFTTSLESIGIEVKNAAQMDMKVANKELMLIQCIQACDKAHADDGGFLLGDLCEEMAKYKEMWPDAWAAKSWALKGDRVGRLTYKPDGGERMRAS